MEWEWRKANEKELAQFVNVDAQKLLVSLSGDERIKLLQNSAGRRKLVRKIYEALVQKKIHYAFEKYQPRDEIQLIRTPAEIIKMLEGTCLDLALLFCSLCFANDLLPLIIVLEGHALAAVSLRHQRKDWNAYGPERALFITKELFQGSENLAKLQEFIENEAYIAVECTGFAHTQSFSNDGAPEAKERSTEGVLSFDRAIEAGLEQLNNPSRPFKFAIDVAVAQYDWGIQPLEISPNLRDIPSVNVYQKLGEIENTNLIGLNGKPNEQTSVIQNVDRAKNSKIIGVKATGEI